MQRSRNARGVFGGVSKAGTCREIRKRHHYVPVTYLRGFTNASGHLEVYRKDESDRPFLQRPEATGFERYYYSQTAENGSRDNVNIELAFSRVDGRWPRIVAKFERPESMFPKKCRV